MLLCVRSLCHNWDKDRARHGSTAHLATGAPTRAYGDPTAPTGTRGGRGRMTGPTAAGWTSPSNTEPVITEIDEDGDYRVSFPGAGSAGGHAFAGIMGTPPMFCTIHSTVSGAPVASAN